MTAWQLQTAKARFSELIREVKAKGPAVITLHGREEAVVMSRKDYDELRATKPGLVQFFRDSPLHGIELDLRRNKSVSRRVDL